MNPILYIGDPLGEINLPEDFPLPALPRVSDPAQAHLLLFPWFWQDFGDQSISCQFSPGIAAALQHRLPHLEAVSCLLSKPLLIFRYHDSSAPLPHRHGWVWRTSLNASRCNHHEAALPAFHSDVTLQAAELGMQVPPAIPWQTVPSVGFCGQAMPLHFSRSQQLLRGLRIALRRPQPGPFGYWLRRSALRSCLRFGSSLQCRFFVTHPADPTPPAEQKRRFLANLFGSAYTICASGYGNYSYRFYETLSAGRIPVLIDSDVLLPFEDQVRWSDLIVRIPANKVHSTPEHILAFHRRFTPKQFLAHQQRLRRLWEDICTPVGFQHSLEAWLQTRFTP